MRILADESVEGEIVVRLRSEGHDVAYVPETSAGIRDDEVLARANTEDRVLLTEDMDFGDLAFNYGSRCWRIFEKPKNGKGRSVKCSHKATEALKRHRARQNEERLGMGSLWEDNGLVFPTITGTTMSGTYLLGRHFKPLLKRRDCPPSDCKDNNRHLLASGRGDGRRAGRGDGRGTVSHC